MLRPRAAARPSAGPTDAAVAASTCNVGNNAAVLTPRHPVAMPFSGCFRPPGVPPPVPYLAPLYAMTMRCPPVLPLVRPPVGFPRPHVYLPPPLPPGGFNPHPGPIFNPLVYPRYITQYPVYQQPPGFPSRPINPPIGVLSHQRPVVVDGTFGHVTVVRPPIAPVAPADEPEFKVFVGKIASTVDSDFVLSLLQVCGVVKSWNPVTHPIDGTRTAFGFCDFESAEGSLRAKRLLNKLSIDGQELVLNVNEATKVYLQKFGGNTTEEDAKEAETETRDGMVSVADNGNDSSRAIPDLMKRGAVVVGQMSSQGKTKRCRYGTEEYSDSDKDAMQKIRIMIEDRMKSKFPYLSTPPAQPFANIIDEKCDNDTRSSALEEGEISRQCETEERFRESRAVGLQCRKDGEVSAAGKSSLQIDVVSSMHVSMEWESTVEHKGKRQQGEREFHMNSDEDRMKSKFPCLSTPPAKRSASIIDEKGDNDTRSSALEEGEISRQCETEEQLKESRAVGLQGRKDGEVSAAGKSSLQIDGVSSMHVSMEREFTVEHERKHQHGEREFHMNSDEEKGIACLPGLVSDKHDSSAPGEKVDLESQATSKSGNEETLYAKQLLAAVPRTKEELFAYDVNWAIYDKHGLHEKMRPWISEKTVEIFGEEIPEFVDYVVASTKEHVEAPRMLEALASLMDHSAEEFVLSVWTELIFEIKKAETGLA